MTKPIARDPIYRRRRFQPEIIELCVSTPASPLDEMSAGIMCIAAA